MTILSRNSSTRPSKRSALVLSFRVEARSARSTSRRRSAAASFGCSAIFRKVPAAAGLELPSAIWSVRSAIRDNAPVSFAEWSWPRTNSVASR